MAAIPFKNREADTAVEIGNPARRKKGEKINPPPSPIMVRINEDTNITGRIIKRLMVKIPFKLKTLSDSGHILTLNSCQCCKKAVKQL